MLDLLIFFQCQLHAEVGMLAKINQAVSADYVFKSFTLKLATCGSMLCLQKSNWSSIRASCSYRGGGFVLTGAREEVIYSKSKPHEHTQLLRASLLACSNAFELLMFSVVNWISTAIQPECLCNANYETFDKLVVWFYLRFNIVVRFYIVSDLLVFKRWILVFWGLGEAGWRRPVLV